jgi:hypothetical protein
VIGSLAAIPLSRTVPPMRLATAGILWVSAPLLLLGLELPAIGVIAVMFAAGLGAVATAPLMAILTTRAPAELRPKVMTAVITLITISGPVTVLALGWLLESFDVRTILLALAIGRVVMAVAFAVIVPRRAGPVAMPPTPGEAVA